MVAAVDPQILLAEGRVDEIAMMRLRRIGMRIGPEIPATHTHALNGNGALFLKLADNGHELHEKLLLIIIIKGGGSPIHSAGSLMAGPDHSPARTGDDDADGAAIGGIGALFDQRLTLEREDKSVAVGWDTPRCKDRSLTVHPR